MAPTSAAARASALTPQRIDVDRRHRVVLGCIDQVVRRAIHDNVGTFGAHPGQHATVVSR